MSIDNYFSNFRPEMAEFLPPSFSRTLEVGCGTGSFSSKYLGRAEERWGIEPNSAAALIAQPKFSKLLIGTYDQVASEIPQDYFDLVVCNDVIEHMPDHEQFLREIAQKMKVGSVIVGSIPNIRHLTALVKLLVFKDWQYTNDGILDRTHLRFFTKKSLYRALTSNGFSVERLEGIRSIVRSGVTGFSPLQNVGVKAVATFVVAASLGSWSDTQYPQFAFRAIRLANELT